MPKFIYPAFNGTGANIGIGAQGDACAVCGVNLDGYVCRLSGRALVCLLCAADALPPDVRETIAEMEQQHGKRRD